MLFRFLFISILGSVPMLSEAQFYKNDRGDKHLSGPFELSVLKTDTSFSDWFEKSYGSFNPAPLPESAIEKLEEMTVEVYLGTWCGDSKRWVPKFIKLWDELGLSRDNLSFVGLYSDSDRYKQSRNGEEVGKKIHRVPTFIFYKNENEVGRIVERPSNGLISDVAQIAMGYPSRPFYQAAQLLYDKFEVESIDSLEGDISYLYREIRPNVRKNTELNTLGYVLLAADRDREANIVFELNTYLFPRIPNTYDSYGESLFKLGRIEEAKVQYEKALLLDPSNENARKMLTEIRTIQ